MKSAKELENEHAAELASLRATATREMHKLLITSASIMSPAAGATIKLATLAIVDPTRLHFIVPEADALARDGFNRHSAVISNAVRRAGFVGWSLVAEAPPTPPKVILPFRAPQ